MSTTKWPKVFPQLTSEQEAIRNDFLKHWHEVLPSKFGFVDRFNHGYVATHAGDFRRTLEIGAGLGEHLNYEKLSPEQEQNYIANDLRPNMLEQLRARYPRIQTILGDCQTGFDFPDGHFDRILAVHVLEHLPNLPAAVREIHRLLDKQRGFLQIVIPCEGGLAYSLGRNISAKRIFEKRYQQSYSWFIEREHVNVPREILGELQQYFDLQVTKYWPLPVPVIDLNLCIALRCVPKS